mgnify:CR=1 FL=1
MCTYVNFEEGDVSTGWEAFYDAPRYSTGYTALFETIGFMPETHMLKPFADRVKSTYAFMQTVINAMPNVMNAASKKIHQCNVVL